MKIERVPQNPSDVQTHVHEMREELVQISNDVQGLSHELHSSKLEYLGAVAGIRSWCREFGERHRMEITFTNDVSSMLPLEVGVCLFRILQEALHNAVKHSGVRRVEVQLAEKSNEVHLTISDSGKGFDLETAQQGAGLGLTSMQERVRLLNGAFSIESKPMSGTRINVHLPLGESNSVHQLSA